MSNLLLNPGAETDATTGTFVSNGATITRDTTKASQGVASFKVVTAATAFSGIQMTSATGLALVGTRRFTAGADISGDGTVRYWMRLQYADTTILDTPYNDAVLTGAATWDRLTVPPTAMDPAKTVDRVWFMARTPTATAVTFNLDNASVSNDLRSLIVSVARIGSSHIGPLRVGRI